MIARVKAFGVHFSISVFFITLFLLAVFYIWYPYPFNEFYSTWDVIKIVAGVDVILGPLLTFVVFNKLKNPVALKRDLSIIVFVQVVALAWGVHITYSARPALLVFSNSAFFVFSKNEIDVSKLKYKELEPLFYESLQIAYLKPPENAEEYQRIVMDIAQNGSPDIIYRSNRYLPVSDYWEKIYRFSLKMGEITKVQGGGKAVNDFLENNRGQFKDYAFYRVRSGRATSILAINKDTDEIVGLVNRLL